MSMIKSEQAAAYGAAGVPNGAQMSTADVGMLDDDAIVAMAIEITTKRMREQGVRIAGPSDVHNYLRLTAAGFPYEVFGCMWLDTSGHLIAAQQMFRGTIDHAGVYPREVCKAALAQNARSVVFYHNHPSGNARPSADDLILTKRLMNALDLLSVQVLDHMIVGGTSIEGRIQCVSLSQLCWHEIEDLNVTDPRELADLRANWR